VQFPSTIQEFSFGQYTCQLSVPDAASVQKAYREGAISFPYWSQVWPAAVALTQFIVKHSELVQNKNVLEIAAGLGLPSIVAAHYAQSVLCTDAQPEVIDYIQASAKQNRINNLETAALDWNKLPMNLHPEVLLLSDVNYAHAAFEGLTKTVHYFLEQNTTILLSTPQRLIAKEFVNPFVSQATHQEEIIVDHLGKQTAVVVLMLKKTATS
jgi:predicted nicotinamide N-methyase